MCQLIFIMSLCIEHRNWFIKRSTYNNAKIVGDGFFKKWYMYKEEK